MTSSTLTPPKRWRRRRGPFVDRLRRIKHGGFLLRKWCRLRYRSGRVRFESLVVRGYRSVHPYRYRPTFYSETFLVLRTESETVWTPTEVPQWIWCLWTGENAMPETRLRSLDSIRDHHPDVEVRLVSRDNIDEWVLPQHALHPAYRHLSLVHRSDYLRSYLMHFYGGGYCDIKPLQRSWAPAFSRLAANPDGWMLGYRELSVDMCAQLPGRLGRDIRWSFPQLLGNGAFICRPSSPLTTEWYAELLRRMDAHADELERHPGDERGDNEGYPIRWNELLGDILQPLGLKYVDRLIIDDAIRPSFRDYR
jgi:hypothetical protein